MLLNRAANWRRGTAASFVWLGASLLASMWMYCQRQRRTGFLILTLGVTIIVVPFLW